MPTAVSDVELVLEHLRKDFEFYCRNCIKIVTKQGRVVPFELNAGQRALVRVLFAMKERGWPMRVVILKARQIGFSTLAQALTIWRTTLQENHKAIVVAHDLETGALLYGMGRTMWMHLPEDDELPLKPPVSSFKRSRFMHFGSTAEAWQHGDAGLNSQYLVSTASETESGRGGTYRTVHGSEVAMWPDIDGKVTSLLSAVPGDPDTLVIWEATAKGFNGFKDMWDKAEKTAAEDRPGFLPFFWPWWKHEEYTMPFLSNAERERFRPGDTEQSIYAEREPLLLDPGPLDYETREHTPLTLEQLNWRRWSIDNNCNGKLDKFNEEFPTEPEDAFLSTGSYVFEAMHIRRIQNRDVREPDHTGAIESTKRELRAGMHGQVEVPTGPQWKSVEKLMPGVSPDWKLWLDLEEDEQTKEMRPPKDGLYVIGVDVSGGVSEAEEGEPAFHAIEVIDHRTREQVAEYSSRVDPPLLAEHVFLTAHWFNEAWLGIEITGGYGMPISRTVAQDWRYRFSYMRKSHDRRMDHEQDKFGWDTRPNTKPTLLALGAEIIKQEEDSGIRSVALTREMLTYTRNDSGKTMPERGKFADRLMAWLIAQQIALQLPLRARKPKSTRPTGFKPKNPITGY